MLCFFDILKYMKYKLLVLGALCAIALTGCKKANDIFKPSYKIENIQIKDTLPKVENKTAHIAFLYGQSNADGVSYDSYLKKNDEAKFNEYAEGYNNVFINYINDGGNNSSELAFRKASLGCGCATYTYGPEVGIAEKMSKAFPDEQSFIIKWTWGGTTLHDQWLDAKGNRGELFYFAMDFSVKCVNYLLSKGYTLSVEGICWMQGENDACWDRDWSVYYNDTVAFVSYLREDLVSYSNNIKFIDAGINEEEGIWKYWDRINKAKQEFAKLSESNIYIDTFAMGLTSKNEPEEKPDGAHYDSISMVKLGQAFGDILVGN